MASVEKTLFVVATELKEIDGQSNIPTALCYSEDTILFGREAIEQIKDGRIVNTNFKIELGESAPDSDLRDKKLFEANDGAEKTAFELTRDFLNLLLDKVEGQEAIPTYKREGLKIVVAEPLAFQIEDRGDSWIRNYRQNIIRILHRYETVEFLPEAFAVYQYYRYGLKIPQLSEGAKHVALIIDFGGGTFDVSVIESTKTGDISQTGKHAKPHAASSEPVGGFYVNEKIGEYLIARNLEHPGDKNKASQYIKTFYRVQKGELDFDSLNQEKKTFIRNLKRVIQKAEDWKIELCKKITEWDLSGDCYEKVLIEIPKNPFLKETVWDKSSFYGHELRKIFITQIWDEKIKKVLNSALNRAEAELKQKKITVTLISGGSSNIRWLERLIDTEFVEKLSQAKPIPLSGSFQEVVAKGLAIECARRHYDPDSEFVSVTYNPLRLLLDPDDEGIEQKRFSSVENKIDMGDSEPCLLIPSAQALRNFIAEPLQWRVKLSSPPRRFLKYYFMRPSEKPLHEQPMDLDNLFNVDNVVHTSPDTVFDSKIRVELTVREDGTTIPKFIYRVGNPEAGIDEYSEVGQPFVIDMTSENKVVSGSRYIGLDFGTSNTSLCFLTNQDIHTIEYRSTDASWRQLKDLISKLPYAVSFPIRRYLSISNIDRSVENAREAFESILSFAAYTSACELIAVGGMRPTIMKSFQHRSMGPLKALLETCLERLGREATFVAPFKVIFEKFSKELDVAITEFNEHKHKKRITEKVNAHEHLGLFANLCHNFMENKVFGFFEFAQPSKFRKKEYHGTFRVAHDNQPFCESYRFSGSELFDSSEPFIVDITTKKALSLLPFYFWEEDSETIGSLKFYTFDKIIKTAISFKPVDTESLKELGEEYDDLTGLLMSIFSGNAAELKVYELQSFALIEE
jgi:molecular chaperone DnaK (HSP70)